MRSRYCAYVLERADYLLATWHPVTRPSTLEFDDQPKPNWLGLSVVGVEAGGAQDREGVVEFVARYKRFGRATRMHERSQFRRVGNAWYYLGSLEKAGS